MKYTLLIAFLASILIGCEDDLTNTNIETQPIEQFARIDAVSIAIDSSKSLLIYNGPNIKFDSLLLIAEDTFQIAPIDDDLIKGKRYKIIAKDISYDFYRTEMPIVLVNTGAAEIVDEPKIPGSIMIMTDGNKTMNSRIGIELRGGFSQTFPKKSYSLELWEDVEGESTRKESLLGLREDDDWILDGLWNEPLRLRDYTSHDIWLQMGRFHYENEEPETTLGIQRNYCEVFVDGNYRGIYYLGEKVDRKQLNLKKYKDEIRGELYKGSTWAGGVLFNNVEQFSNSTDFWSGYELKYPDDEDKLDWTNLNELVEFVVKSDTITFESKINDWVDVENAVDYFIFLNLINANDNRGKNLYTARYEQYSPYVFVPWDMDGTFGNSWRGLRLDTAGAILSNGLFDRLLKTPEFVFELKDRWEFLKNSTLKTSHIKQMFTVNYEYLKTNGAYERESYDESLPFNYNDSEIEFIWGEIDTRWFYLNQFVQEL